MKVTNTSDEPMQSQLNIYFLLNNIQQLSSFIHMYLFLIIYIDKIIKIIKIIVQISIFFLAAAMYFQNYQHLNIVILY